LNNPQYGHWLLKIIIINTFNNENKYSMFTRDVFPRLTRPVSETTLSSQPNSNPLQNTVPQQHKKSLKLRINHSFHTYLLPLYFTSLLSVPIFTETLRMYPIAPFLERVCCSDYELSAHTGTGKITLPASTGVYIPVLGLHFDAKYFPEPQTFDPDRFTEENKYSRPNYTYIPFGEGPRNCIGKDRHLVPPHKNIIFRIRRILIVILLPSRSSVW
jgi:hypothetical protein